MIVGESREAMVSTRLMARVQEAIIATLRHRLASVTLSMTTTNSPSGVFMQVSVVAKKSVETSLRTWLISHVRGSTYLPQIVGLYHGGRTLSDTPQRSMTQMKPLHPSLYFQGCAYRRRAWELQKQLAIKQPRRI